MTDLCKILKRHGSDKCSGWHNYSYFYYDLFKDLKDKDINLFELGVFFGCSVRAWREFFPKGRIFAADIQRDLLVNEDRIKSFYCDQDSQESIMQLWRNPELYDIEFDIMIDDGKHEYYSNYNFLINSIHKLKKGGIYIVEDLTRFTLEEFRYNLEEVESSIHCSAEVLELPSETNYIDNNLLIIRK